MKSITAKQLRQSWVTQQEIALLDVREEGPYSEAHPLFSLSVPVSEIEHKLPSLVPRISCPVVVYDHDGNYVEEAAQRVLTMGYQDVSILEGGLSAYALVGEVYRDVNVPSKAFGELVESIRHTPSLPAREVKKVIDGDSDVVVLDSRRFEEYNTMSIPRGRSCPGGELLYRVFEAAPSPETTVIVHCAGRTRSILGTQSLINSGIPNKVVALRNGTIGWTLEGLDLEHGKTQRVPQPSDNATQKSREHAIQWAKHVGVPIIDGQELVRLAETRRENRTMYLLDVRDPDEHAAGHLPGFIPAPGGQLVQATDEWVGVRGAWIVLYDTDGVRARMTASWLLQLGWEVYVLETGCTVPCSIPCPDGPNYKVPQDGGISVDELKQMADATVVDLARSPAYRKGHIPGAYFASGPELARDLKTIAGSGPLVLTSPEDDIAASNLPKAQASVSRKVYYLRGGTSAWVQDKQPLETEERLLSEPADVYKRPYEGTTNARKDMQAYLDWEYGLIAQLANDGVACFHVVRDKSDRL